MKVLREQARNRRAVNKAARQANMTPSQILAKEKAHARKVKEFLQKQAQARAAAKARAAARNAASTARNAAQTHGIPSMPKTNMIPV